MANLRANNLTGTGGRNAIDGSVFFGGTGDYLSIDDSADLELGSGDFTFEGWFYFGNTGSSGTTFWGKWNSPNRSYTFAYVKSTGTYTFGYSTDGSAEVLLTSDALSADIDTWVHFAAVRNGSSLKVYRNGISIIDASVGSATFYNATTDLYIGRLQSNTNYDYKGYVSNFRLIKGTALYTANFTPPTEKLTAVENTVLLCCQDSDDPTQEATGKTITGFGGNQESNDTELVTNSGFTVDISGWTTSGVQWTHSSGALMHFGNGDTQRNAYQNVTTVVGKKYVARVLASSAEASTAYWQIAGATINYVADNNNSAQLEYRYYFTATSTSTQIRFYSYDSGNSGNVRSYWYLASIKLAPQGKTPKFLPPVGIDEGVVVDGYTKINSPGVMYFPTGDTSQRGRGRGLFAGGYCPNNTEVIQYIEIQSMSNTIDFGDLSNKYRGVAGFGSKTRGVFSGGAGGSPTGSTLINTMEYVTISNRANALDFGDMVSAARNVDGCSNSTRGILFGGQLPSGKQNVIQYSTIATTGNTTDFGDVAREDSNGTAFASSTRACVAGGFDTSVADNVIEYVTIATTGNATNFGDLLGLYAQQASVASSTRGVVCTGSIGPTPTTNSNVIQYVTIASTGDSVDFGDYVTVGENVRGVTNSLRGVFAGGYCPNFVNTMNYITIATTGNSSDFGDILNGQTSPNTGMSQAGNTSDSHGGLS